MTMDFLKECEIEGSDFNINYAENNMVWNFLKDTYYENIKKQSENPIPNIFHFIWLGGNLPKMYEENIKDWEDKNPSFDIIIWDDRSSEKLMKTSKNHELFKYSENFGTKSDILRYEILFKYGGVYLDTDFLCVSNKFNDINKICSFYGCLMMDKDPLISNGILASRPNHEILKNCIDTASDKTYQNISCKQTRILFQTGPFLLTKCFFEYVFTKNSDDSIIFPTSVFFPFPAIHRRKATKELIQYYVRQTSMACHLWHCSWQQDSKFYLGEVHDD